MVDYIHFVGPWRDDERQRVTQAVKMFESKTSLRALPREYGKPWIAAAQELSDARYLIAHRVGIYDTVMGSTADELATALLMRLDRNGVM